MRCSTVTDDRLTQVRESREQLRISQLRIAHSTRRLTRILPDLDDFLARSLLMLLSMAAVAYCDKPLDWLTTDILWCVLLVMNLCCPISAINTSVSIPFQEKRPLTLPIVRL
jgi:hypothetical protein